MKNELNNNFIKNIEAVLPENANIAYALMDILGIGKEAVYRRLRNDVPFTFHEVATVAKTLGLSVDRVMGNFDNNCAVFNLNLIHSDRALSNYEDMMRRCLDYFIYIKADPMAVSNTISNTIPYTLYGSYEYLSKFRLCRWLHQTDKLKPAGSLDQIDIPQTVLDLNCELTDAVRDVPTTILIWDSHMFKTVIREIEYFYNLNLISEKDVQLLKEDLLRLIDEADTIASIGAFPNGNGVKVYLSNIHFEASFSFLQKKNFEVSIVKLYSVNTMDSMHPEVNQLHREWVQTLKRYSTVITGSGEMQRVTFFTKQKELVNKLL